ncbi:MAG: hypothetical protein ACRDRK_02380 [Pseudonocardia sp.]
MLDGFAEIFGLANDVWPSFGGAFVPMPMPMSIRLLLILAVITAASMPASGGPPAARGVGVLIVAVVVALVLPGALVLHLMTDTASSMGVTAL